MKIPPAARDIYHPSVDAIVKRTARQRDSAARLNLIAARVDFSGKTVIDLGCSGGFFTLSLAKLARHVIGIDSDEHIISRNRLEAKRLGIDNVEFLCAPISADSIAQLKNVDVVLFLSVFHHILASTDVYDGNVAISDDDILLLLKRIAELPDTYVFEMGEPWEPCEDAEWAAQVRRRTGDLDKWITSNVFGNDYDTITKVNGVAYQRWPFTAVPSAWRLACTTAAGRAFLKVMRINRSDFRSIWIGKRK